jgi:uncharacterized LabA/DUF88 family protein
MSAPLQRELLGELYMRNGRDSHRLAVLIDADNTSARYATAIFDEIASLGEANVRRIYGDFSGARLGTWDLAVQSLAILQHQQRSNTIGKNAADIALVIDAMDLMYEGAVDGFCLVSSDSDFTRLAQRLREDGLAVYGFGERKTPEAFRIACTRFIYVENLIEAAGPAPAVGEPDVSVAPERHRKKEPPSKATPTIFKAMAGLEDDEGWAPLAGVGSRIMNIAPDFDPRSFGQTKLSALV